MARQVLVFVILALLALAVGVTTPDRAAANPLTGVASVSAGAYYTCALTTSGNVKCWGDNGFGQYGNGTMSGSNIATDASGLSTAVGAMDAGGQTTCALTPAGGLKCWGDNQTGELGIGNSSGPEMCSGSACSTTPLDVNGLSSGVSAFSVGAIHTCAVTTSGGVKCWGWNHYGQLGNGSNTGPEMCGSVPVYEPCSTTPLDVVGLTGGVTAVSAGETHTCAITTAGGVKCWGGNAFGALGNGTTTSSSTPVDVTGLTSGIAAVSAGTDYTCAVTTAGGLKCWGANVDGQLGIGNNTGPQTCGSFACSTTPVDVLGLTSGVSAISAGLVGQIVAGPHTCALTASGGVKCWGSNAFGELGDGTSTGPEICTSILNTAPCSTTPVDVTGLASGASGLSTGANHTCAVTIARGVECWGWNASGQLGNGNYGLEPSTTPVDVVGVNKTPLTTTPTATRTSTLSATPTPTFTPTPTTTPTPMATQPSVGGISVDAGINGLPAAGSRSTAGTWTLAGVVASLAAGALGLVGAVWLARRRLGR